MKDLILTLVLLAILAAAAGYIYKAKKSGAKCIGCPSGSSCSSCSSCGGSCGCHSGEKKP